MRIKTNKLIARILALLIALTIHDGFAINGCVYSESSVCAQGSTTVENCEYGNTRTIYCPDGPSVFGCNEFLGLSSGTECVPFGSEFYCVSAGYIVECNGTITPTSCTQTPVPWPPLQNRRPGGESC
jgi:hypothetical protein